MFQEVTGERGNVVKTIAQLCRAHTQAAYSQAYLAEQPKGETQGPAAGH